MLTRRDVLQRAGTATALVTTASWWLVRRAHAARQHKLIVWVPTALAPQVDKILQSSVSPTPSRQASKTRDRLFYSWCRPNAAQTGRGA